tara:strand:+ start:19972 stop:20403 length:432 start_codon:yes stop_codon:yes gene_type:complete
MKKLFFITILLTSFTVFSQDDNHDYKWLVGGSTGGDITLGSPEATGNIGAHALYMFSDKLLIGGEAGLGIGNDGDLSLKLSARYHAFNKLFVVGKYDLTDDMGADVGLGYGFDVAKNVEFAPEATYNTEMEEMGISFGFSIRF